MAYPRSAEGYTGEYAVSEFLLRACHDIRTPLRAIRAHSERLLKRSDPQSLGFIVDSAAKIDLLVDGLASYAIALQTDSESFQPVQIDVLLRSVLAKMEKDLRGQNAQVTYGELPCVPGNPDRLMQVFENLLRNALHHRGPAAPHIHVAAERQSGAWQMSVQDNGPGVEAPHLERIFQPFERMRAAHPGPGLGLAICRAVIERHGGRIRAESKEGTGAEFLFTLPAS